jgi:hypothetical protein
VVLQYKLARNKQLRKRFAVVLAVGLGAWLTVFVISEGDRGAARPANLLRTCWKPSTCSSKVRRVLCSCSKEVWTLLHFAFVFLSSTVRKYLQGEWCGNAHTVKHLRVYFRVESKPSHSGLHSRILLFVKLHR